MNSVLIHLADHINAEREGRFAQRSPRDDRHSFNRVHIHPPASMQKDSHTMNPWFLDSTVQLYLAEMKHDEMIRNSLLRQQLREMKTTPSLVLHVRSALASALFSLGHAVKPASLEEEWGETTPRTVA